MAGRIHIGVSFNQVSLPVFSKHNLLVHVLIYYNDISFNMQSDVVKISHYFYVVQIKVNQIIDFPICSRIWDKSISP